MEQLLKICVNLPIILDKAKMASTATSQPDYSALVKTIQSGKPAPVYLLYGEEGYFIDCLVKEFENLIPEADRDFNLYNIYGPESSSQEIIEACRRYPIMSDRQVVIVREAQTVNANEINKLAPYAGRPTDTTVLVITMRGTRETKGKDLVAAVKKNGVLFESKKLNDRESASYITQMIKAKQLHIEAKGLSMLRDYVGNDLSRIHNEVDKLTVALPAGATITPEVIEKNIGISKDYNNFELIDALVERDVAKSLNIISFFAADPKNNPTTVTVSALFNFFANLMIFQFNPDKSADSQKRALGLKSDWQLKKYVAAARNYNASMTIEIISALREMDTKSKGIGSRMGQYDLLRDLIFRILSVRGTLTSHV